MGSSIFYSKANLLLFHLLYLEQNLQMLLTCIISSAFSDFLGFKTFNLCHVKKFIFEVLAHV